MVSSLLMHGACKEVPNKIRVSEDGKVEIWWDRSTETTRKLKHKRSAVTIFGQLL